MPTPSTQGAGRRADRTAPSTPTRVLAVFALLTLGGVGNACRAPESGAPDLTLAWADSAAGEPLDGRQGEEVVLGFRLRNRGSGVAYGAAIYPTTTAGPALEPIRFIPGPEPGEELYGATQLALIEGQTEICLEARVVRRARTDIAERELDDNRICRPIRLAGSGLADELAMRIRDRRDGGLHRRSRDGDSQGGGRWARRLFGATALQP